jgi:hypothetical protein
MAERERQAAGRAPRGGSVVLSRKTLIDLVDQQAKGFGQLLNVNR